MLIMLNVLTMLVLPINLTIQIKLLSIFPEMAAEAYNRVRFVKRRDSSENNPGELILDEEYRLVGWMDEWMVGLVKLRSTCLHQI